MIIDAAELCVSNLTGQGRVLCIDYGDRRVGIALSDINWIISSPYTVLESNGIYPKLQTIIVEKSVVLIVVGLPHSLSGGCKGKQLEKVRKFVTKLETITETTITYWDERLSTVSASHFLDEANIKNRNKKVYIDKVAASLILTGFLDYCSLRTKQLQD